MGWLLSRMYDRFLQGAEDAGLSDWRRELLRGARGAVLELGAGTGGNLGFYPRGLSRLVLSEPDRHMRALLQRKVGARTDVEILAAPAESVPLPGQSFDTVVATLVLCSVEEPARALGEIRRLLRPGGTFLFLEHVGAPRGTWTRRGQAALEPVWKHVAGNCHLTRETGPLLVAAGFELVTCTEAALPGSSPLMVRSIRGVARASGAGHMRSAPGSS